MLRLLMRRLGCRGGADNYPHVTAIYWSLYRLGRYHTPPLATRHGWAWYLRQAHATAMAMWRHGGEVRGHEQRRVAGEAARGRVGNGSGTSQWGVMVGSVSELLLLDLRREGWAAQAAALQETVERRMGVWLQMPFPYGSEFAWDSTGHEEIGTWLFRFNHSRQAAQTVAAITAFTSLSPHWAYCGATKRWWDFFINGDESLPHWGNERVGHHYAAALASIPLFQQALRTPHDAWLWRLAACAGSGTLSNVRGDGSASMGWHLDPSRLTRDGLSADFGVGFYGHWRSAGVLRGGGRWRVLPPSFTLHHLPRAAGSYLVCDAELGWLCLGCDVVEADGGGDGGGGPRCGDTRMLRLVPRDAFRRRVYLQPLALLVEVEGAALSHASLRLSGHADGAATASLHLTPNPPSATHAILALSGDGTRRAQRRARLACAAPCALAAAPFPGRAPGVHRVEFGSAAGASVDLVL